VARRVLPALLAVAAAFADARGAHGLAFDALLGAVPFAAVSALVAFGTYLEDRENTVGGVQALLWTVALVLLVLSCAARSPNTEMHTLPPLGASSLMACLGVFAIKLCVAVVPLLGRIVLRPAKP
jgi:peptidoglycan/LPS O-acetylase OafA/YrhL